MYIYIYKHPEGGPSSELVEQVAWLTPGAQVLVTLHASSRRRGQGAYTLFYSFLLAKVSVSILLLP